MSAICQNFVQNAWKKELCSNCFKSKDEHTLLTKVKPIALNFNKTVESIIKGDKLKPKRSVCFTSELSEIIGYGGEDWSVESDDSDSETSGPLQEDYEIEEEVEEDERELYKLTKANTDFNGSSLADCEEMKKSYTQLMLGKPQVDATGRKQTLLVSVTPFGQQDSNSTRKYPKPISHIPIAKNNKESIPEIKVPNVILTAYTKNEVTPPTEEKSLLDEITETLENSQNPIKIISRKKTQKDIILAVAKPDNNKENLEERVNEAQNEDDRPQENKITKTSIPERKNGISRAPVIIKRDQEKPIIYQTSTAKIELLNTKNTKYHSNKDNSTNNYKSDTNNKDNKTEENPKNVDLAKNVECDKEKVAIDTSNQETNADQNNVKTLSQKLKDLNTKLQNADSETTSSDSDSRESSLKEPDKVLGLPPQVPKYNGMVYPSREQVGEPDGRADPDVSSEPPALPLTPPPPLEIQSSFLHGAPQPYEKPKVPSKPTAVCIRKQFMPMQVEAQNHTLTTFAPEIRINGEEKMKLSQQDSTGSDVTRGGNKRRAPKPPEESGTIYTRNSTGPINLDSPVVREREKRERASSCSPQLRNGDVSENPQGEPNYASIPEPAPRKSLSISTDSLNGTGVEEKRKEKAKGRFSLKKFLRMGASPKDAQKLPHDIFRNDDIAYGIPQPKPRLVIVHPLDLNGAKVEVVSKPMILDNVDYSVPNNICSSDCTDQNCNASRTAKPPPPPRNLDDYSRGGKPTLPTPPKSAEILYKQKQLTRINEAKKVDSVYANIGEVRTAITPHKPQRTASMREREAQQEKQKKAAEKYEHINLTNKDCNENVYDYINSGRSSSPEYDSSPDKNSPTSKTARSNGLLKQKSESNVDVSGECFKYSIPRSMSLTYCGSETESEIYSPYSFYGSESEVCVTEDDHDWTSANGRTHKLRSRKGRSIVHKNLEDNYGAVIVANHEALAQVLENIQQSTTIQPALRGLKTSLNLRWSDFIIKATVQPVIVGTRAFHQALWGTQHVTLMICAGSTPTSSISLGIFNLIPITEFSDLIPSKYLSNSENDDTKQVQATVAVLPWMQIMTIQSFGDSLRIKSQANEDTWKDGSFVLLQLVHALKILQAQGIEELPLSLTSFVLCREVDKDVNFRLCVLQSLSEEVTYKNETNKYGTLCMCVSKALTEVLPAARTTHLIQSLLNTERAVSLTQVKSVLEFSLWGPSDVALGSTIRERELALQRWLDLQRATVLHGLVCTRVQLTVYEECHLLFLVRSNTRMMCDASLLLESSNMQQAASNGIK